MAKIEDFGRFVPGAAKHRMPEAPARPQLPGLTEIFPEPEWGRLALPARTIALMRAMREAIAPPPPCQGGQASPKRLRWEARARAMARLARELADQADPDASYRRVAGHAHIAALLPKARTYERIGHRQSLAKISVVQTDHGFTAVQGRKPPEILYSEPDLEAFARRTLEWLESDRAKLPKVSWGTRNLKTGGIMVCAKAGGAWIDVERHESLPSAMQAVRQDKERLAGILRRILNPPRSRHEQNRSRQGPARLDGAIDEEAFIRRFGVSAQFGASLPEKEKVGHLGEAYEAFVDLAEALGWESGALSFGGRLAIGFASRGRGGRNAAKAHYEPDYNIINLTRRAGAGSLGHEWFHGFDRNDDSAIGSYSTKAGAGPLGQLMRDLAATRVARRSRGLDAGASKPYWATPVEVSARCFEAWLKDRLDAMGIRNDYLVNILSEEDWQGVDDPGLDRYPYPKAEEMALVDQAFSRLFEIAPNAELRRGAGHSRPAEFAPDDRFDHLIGLQHPAPAVLLPGPTEDPWEGLEVEIEVEVEGVAPAGAEPASGRSNDDMEAKGWFELDI